VNNYGTNDNIKVGELDDTSGTAGFSDAINTDYVEYYKKTGNDSLSIRWWIDKSGIITGYQKKVYLPALDTTTFNLFF
jgi:hypothetical protein